MTSSPAGIDCGTTCSDQFASGTIVQLTAEPATGSQFAGWSGHSDCSDGQVTMNANKTCTATFNKTKKTLTVSKAGAGSGTVTSNPAGINCGGDCSQAYDHGTTVQIIAAPSIDSTFAGWGGASDCLDGNVTMTASTGCVATFDLRPTFQLSVSKSGTGSGVITSTPSGINCGSDCQEACYEGETMLLSGTPSIGHELTSWGGHADCVDGVLSMNGARACTATFSPCSSQSVVDVLGEIAGPSTRSACNHLRLGPDLRITETGALTAAAGNTVTLYNGFRLEAGGRLTVILGQPMP